ncbi:MAG: DUF481 domain-containing protein [Acidobacteriaceae bacterium]
MIKQLSILVSLLAMTSFAFAQAPAKPAASKPADVLIFANGDQLTGKLESVTAGNVIFDSAMAGKLTISIDKIKELRSGAEFALLRKGVPVGKAPVPEGSVEVASGALTLTPTSGQPPAVVPAKEVDYLIDRTAFDKQMNHHASFLSGWGGTVTGGAVIERSTTTGTTFNAGVALVRAIPTVPWMLPRNRTTVDVTEAYGKLSTPIIPPTTPPTAASVVISSIFHADAERDQYFSPRVYALGDTSFDHNFGQGLKLQQVYGGGIGFTAIKSPRQELDLKADAHYEKQQYISTTVGGVTTTTPPVNIIGTTVFEAYSRNLPRKMLFTQTANVLPAWNNFKAYSANFTAALAIPVFKRFSASVSVADNFLNDPAAYYKKNSFQFITGVTYVLP